MALTTTEEALIRQLLDQQAALLSLAGNESTITSKLGATKVTLSDLVSASAAADADLLLMRQGVNDKSITPLALGAYMRAGLATQNGVQAGEYNTSVAGGTADAITATYAPAITTLADGQLCFFRASAVNATTTPSFSPNGLTARTITMKGGAAVHVGAIPAALAEVILRYNLANTRWELLNPAAIEPVKYPVRVATTANITLSGGAPNTLDGATLAANDRILVKNQSTASENGIYYVSTLGTGANGTWTRASDADGAGDLFGGMLVAASEGTARSNSLWMLTTDDPITIGTTALVFERKDAPVASTAEAQAWTENTKIITALRLKEALQGSNQSLATSGYQKLPGGLLIQWGNAGTIAAGSSATVTYPIAFPSGALSASTTISTSTDTTTPQGAGLTYVSATQLTIRNLSATTLGFTWIAIGH